MGAPEANSTEHHSTSMGAPANQNTSGHGGIAAATEAMFDEDGASRALGIELLAASGGYATARMTVTSAMVNGHSVAHGGYVFLLADTAFACACNTHGPVTVAASAEITFVEPAYAGDDLYAVATERTQFGRNGIYDITVRRGRHGAVVAEFRGHSRTIKATRENLAAPEPGDGEWGLSTTTLDPPGTS